MSISDILLTNDPSAQALYTLALAGDLTALPAMADRLEELGHTEHAAIVRERHAQVLVSVWK